MPVTKLGDALVLEKSTASRLAKGLMDRGLVRKRSPQSDSRVVILQLTEQGQRLSRKILNELSREYMEILEPFEPEVRKELPDYLQRLTFHLAAGMDPARTNAPGR
jgi:DNA-binding MarR family transcriptional regulator